MRLQVAGLQPGNYRVTAFDTSRGEIAAQWSARCESGPLEVDVELAKDLALAIANSN